MVRMQFLQVKDRKGNSAIFPATGISTQGVEVPWLTYQQFSNLVGNITDMAIAEQNWQPMIDAIWENRTVEDYETTGSTVKTDFMRK